MAALSAWCGTIGVCVILLYGGVLLLTRTGLAWFLTKHDRNRANNQTPFPWEEVWGMKECRLICKFCEEADSGLSFPLSMVPLIPPDPSSLTQISRATGVRGHWGSWWEPQAPLGPMHIPWNSPMASTAMVATLPSPRPDFWTPKICRQWCWIPYL